MGSTVAIIADRLGWEERQLADRFRVSGMHGKWVNDEDLCLGLPKVNVPDCNLALIRSRSYVRGRLVATLLAEANVPTLNNPNAIACCENKMDLLHALHRANIPVPAFRLVLSRKDLSRSVEEFGLPMVVKPLFGGLGRRVLLVRNRDTVDAFYDYVEDLAHSYERVCVAEPYVPGATLRSFVVGDQPVTTVKFTNSDAEWRSNAATSSVGTKFPQDDEIDSLVQRVARVLGPGIYGVDLFKTVDGLLISEVNHAPGFRAIASASEIDIAATITDYVRELLR